MKAGRRSSSSRPPSSRAAERRYRQAGFTLIELLVCLTIMALIVAFLPFPFPGHAGAGLGNAGDDLATALRETRERAIETGRMGEFALDPATGIYRDGAGQPHTLPRNIHLSLLSGPGSEPGDAVAPIRFFPDGSATGGGVGLALEGRRIEIRVDWLTGRVSVASPETIVGR